MKLSLLFVAILGVATVSAIPTSKVLNRSTRSLSEDWADFWALIPVDKIVEIVKRYNDNDCEFQITVDHLLTDFFRAVIFDLEAMPEFVAFLDHIQASGLDVWRVWDNIRSWLQIEGPRVKPRFWWPPACTDPTGVVTGGLVGFWNECLEVLPLAQLRALFEEKLENSADFAHFIALLSSDDAKVIYAALEHHPVWVEIVGDFNDVGLDVDGFFVWLKELIRWS